MRYGCVWLPLLAAGACSSSSSPSDGGDGGTVDAASTIDGRASNNGDAGGARGTLTWKYDGVMHTADSITAMHMKTGIIDLFEIIGAQATGDGIGIELSDLNPNDAVMITGTYNCPGTNVIELLFTYNVTGSNSPMSCTVTLTQPGMAGVQNAVGTFEAVLSNGKAITEGTFDTPLGTIIHLPPG
jgi:hypothetical protein